ncbi:MAG: hypothetical protein M1393_02725 [Candidatus Thermoplasmatota archaeon]|nr:hypothetical protein [Candidatus Thermoplasmatota archaeon]
MLKGWGIKKDYRLDVPEGLEIPDGYEIEVRITHIYYMGVICEFLSCEA